MTPVKWEEKFDREKIKYWESVAKWQAKATAEPKTGAASEKAAPKPTLIPKKKSRRAEVTFEDCDVPLECRLHSVVDSDSDSDSDDDSLPTTRPLAYAALHALFPEDSDSDDDAPLPLECRMHSLADSDSDDDAEMSSAEHTPAPLPEPDPACRFSPMYYLESPQCELTVLISWVLPVIVSSISTLWCTVYTW